MTIIGPLSLACRLNPRLLRLAKAVLGTAQGLASLVFVHSDVSVSFIGCILVVDAL